MGLAIGLVAVPTSLGSLPVWEQWLIQWGGSTPYPLAFFCPLSDEIGRCVIEARLRVRRGKTLRGGWCGWLCRLVCCSVRSGSADHGGEVFARRRGVVTLQHTAASGSEVRYLVAHWVVWRVSLRLRGWQKCGARWSAARL